MKLSEVTQSDGLACAHLINFLKVGRWDLTGEDSDKLTQVKQWIQAMALEMATQLRANQVVSTPAPVTTGNMRVKAMGPLPTSQGTGPKSTGTKKKSRK